MQKNLEMIERPLKEIKPGRMPLVFHGSGRQLYYTSSSKYGRRVSDMAGSRNIANNLPLYWQQVSPEWLLQQNLTLWC